MTLPSVMLMMLPIESPALSFALKFPPQTEPSCVPLAFVVTFLSVTELFELFVKFEP